MELNPIKNKKIFVFLIIKEENNLTDDESQNLNNILEKNDVKLATIAIDNAQMEIFKTTELAMFLNESMLPCYQVDIPEYAKGYLDNEVLEEEEELEGLISEYNDMKDKESFRGNYLKSWIEHLEKKVQDKREHIEIKVKTQWIVKNMLDLLRYYGDSLFYEESIYILHFTPEKLVKDLLQVLEELGVFVIVADVKSKILPRSESNLSWEVDLCKFSN